jgi:hypothetical protein
MEPFKPVTLIIFGITFYFAQAVNAFAGFFKYLGIDIGTVNE